MTSRKQTRDGAIAPPLPSNIEAEKAVLGAILLDNHTLNTAIEKLTPMDFFVDQHRRIFKCMFDMGATAQPIDLVTLTDGLRRAGELGAAGGAAYLSELIDGVPRVSNVEHYACIVRREAVRRGFIHAAEHMRELVFGTQDVSAIIEASHKQFDGLAAFDSESIFEGGKEFEKVEPLTFAIQDFLQNDAATIIGGLSGQGKTWIGMSMAKALLEGEGTRLWNHFPVRETATRVIYLIPECTRAAFKHRLLKLGMYQHIGSGRLLVRTLSKGPKIPVSDPRILYAAKGAHVFLDTVARFLEGEETKENFGPLADDLFRLIAAGARTAVGLAHSPKQFSRENFMNLENIIRGSGDIGAVFATAWGIKQIDPASNTIHIENVKARDFQPPLPFQLIGRPHIDESGDFHMLNKPGEAGSLADAQPEFTKGGAPKDSREHKAARIALMRQWLKDNPNLTSTEMVAMFNAAGIDVKDSTVRNYRMAL
jgi:hypothetical protein